MGWSPCKTWKLGSIFILSLILILLANACGSGSKSKSSGDPQQPSNQPPQILSSGDRFAQAGKVYEYDVEAASSNGKALTFSLSTSPSGMTIDSVSGKVLWTPTDSQGGENNVTIVVTDGEKSAEQSFNITVQTSHMEVSAPITATLGGTLEVTDASSVLVGAKVIILSGSLSNDTTLTLSNLQNPSFLMPGSLALQLDTNPPASLISPGTLEIPYTQVLLDHLGIVDETNLTLVVFNEKTLVWDDLQTTVDHVSKVISATIPHLSTFAISTALPPGLITTQPRNLFNLKTFHPEQDHRNGFHVSTDPDCKGNQRNVILVHGILSSMNNFEGDNDLIVYARRKYHNVLFYNYPWDRHIGYNALGLAGRILEQGLVPAGAHFDIIAHSMGGLASRGFIEKYSSVLERKVDNLITLGTPHAGADTRRYLNYVGLIGDQILYLPGLLDMEPGSTYLQGLNANPINQSGTHYYTVAGNVGDLSDRFVIVGSATGEIVRNTPGAGTLLRDGTQTFNADHSQLHENMLINGVADQIDQWLGTDEQVLYTVVSPATPTPATIPSESQEVPGASIDLVLATNDESLQLKAQALDPNGVEVGSGFSWSSSNPEVASVDQTGILKAIAEGETCIKAAPSVALNGSVHIEEGMRVKVEKGPEVWKGTVTYSEEQISSRGDYCSTPEIYSFISSPAPVELVIKDHSLLEAGMFYGELTIGVHTLVLNDDPDVCSDTIVERDSFCVITTQSFYSYPGESHTYVMPGMIPLSESGYTDSSSTTISWTCIQPDGSTISGTNSSTGSCISPEWSGTLSPIGDSVTIPEREGLRCILDSKVIRDDGVLYGGTYPVPAPVPIAFSGSTDGHTLTINYESLRPFSYFLDFYTVTTSSATITPEGELRINWTVISPDYLDYSFTASYSYVLKKQSIPREP